MNETSVNPIHSIRLTGPGVSAKLPIPEKVEATAVGAPTLSSSEKSTKPVESESDQAKSISNVSIHFQVDDETQQLTIFVVDKKSKRVIRSIPASELSKLQAGELLKLTA